MKAILLAILPVAELCAQKSTPLDQYIQDATKRAAEAAHTPGSLFGASAKLADLGRDLRSSQVDDLVTIIVSDRASALARGTTTSNRTSAASARIGSILGPVRAAGPLANLLEAESERQLQGQGVTSRENELTTTLSARVTHVLPNGYLVLEGVKDILVNSERQQVTVRGVARWNDVGPGNQVRSDRLANLEIRVSGKGVVDDAIKRPHLVYRILMGLLPF